MESYFYLQTKTPLDLALTVNNHGWYQLAPWQWDETTGVLSRVEVLFNQQLYYVAIQQVSAKQFCIMVHSPHNFDKRIENILTKRVYRWLSLDWKPDELYTLAKRLLPESCDFIERGGAHLLRCSSFYEDFVKTICTINTSWQNTQRMVNDIVACQTGGYFPKPLGLMKLLNEKNPAIKSLGYRAEIIERGTKKLLTTGILNSQGMAEESELTREFLLSLYGLGPYVVAHLRILLNDHSHLPIDSVLKAYCKQNYDLNEDEIENYFSEWGDYKFIGYKLEQMLVK